MTDRDRSLVRSEMEQVILSSQFCNSKRYPALLRFIVEATLAGNADGLKERTLGVEVFDRPPDYDTNTDTVVRYTAGQVRKRLTMYYHEQDGSALQISLPVGSYVPEFALVDRDPGPAEERDIAQTPERIRDVVEDGASGSPAADTVQPAALEPARRHAPLDGSAPTPSLRTGHRSVRPWLAWFVFALLLGAGLVGWRYTHRANASQMFWAPLLAEHGQTVLCVGGVTFAASNFSGVHTAAKDTPYPFASMQIVSSVSAISGILERGGATYGVRAAASAQLSDLREHPLVLIGGYNNDWTLRLLSSLRFHFAPEPNEGIVDTERPGVVWVRDRSQPYGNTDDYALIVRFRDSVTGSMVVAAAGLGRNGTELAAQFLSSEKSLEQLRARLGSRLATANLEVVLRSRVIDGKTGAPQIEATYVW